MVLESQGEYDLQWAAIENSLDDFLPFPNNECLLTIIKLYHKVSWMGLVRSGYEPCHL